MSASSQKMWQLSRLALQRFHHVATTGLLRFDALLEGQLENSLYVAQVLQSPVDLSQPLPDQDLYIRAGRGFAVPHSKQHLHVLQGKTDRLSRPDEFQPPQRFLGVEPIVARTSVFRFQQPNPLIVPQCGDRYAGDLRQLTDGIFSSHRFVARFRPVSAQGAGFWKKASIGLDLTLRCNLDNTRNDIEREEKPANLEKERVR